ncbi:hypothetical protein TKK_0000601 [Trichogramma kaykai]|uniref:BEN domain-containing protein n=1 Tax=Trichogramma kaykai TaxID=54128 RepID=A0ABD2VZM3_9HYME
MANTEKAVPTDADFLDNLWTGSSIPETGSVEAQILALEDRKKKLETVKARIASEMEIIEAKLDKCYDQLQEECEREETETLRAEGEGPSEIRSKRLLADKVDNHYASKNLSRLEKFNVSTRKRPRLSLVSKKTSNGRVLMNVEEENKILKAAINSYKLEGKYWRKNIIIAGVDRSPHVLRKKAIRLIQNSAVERLMREGLTEERALSLKAKCMGVKT